MSRKNIIDNIMTTIFVAMMAFIAGYLAWSGFSELLTGETVYNKDYALYSGISNLVGGVLSAAFTVAVLNLN